MSTYIVAVAVEVMRYGGPEEGGWWYTYGGPSIAPEHVKLTKAFENEDEAVKYCRGLNAQYRDEWDAEYEHDYSSVLGGERIGATIWEDEYPSFYYDVPGCKERPRYE